MRNIILVFLLSSVAFSATAQSTGGSGTGIAFTAKSDLIFNRLLRPNGWTTASRPTSPSNGSAGYNIDSLKWEYWNNTAWVPFSTGSGGGGGSTVLIGGYAIKVFGSSSPYTIAVDSANYKDTLFKRSLGAGDSLSFIIGGTTLGFRNVQMGTNMSKVLNSDSSITLNASNLYTANGTLTSNRTVTTGANTLTFNTGTSTLIQSNGGGTYAFGSVISSGQFSYTMNYINAAGAYKSVYILDTSSNVLFSNNVNINGGEFLAAYASSATSLSMNNLSLQVFTGSSATTWTLPTILSTAGQTYRIKNRGSASITLNAASGDHLYTTSSVTTITITAGNSATLFNDAGFWEVM